MKGSARDRRAARLVVLVVLVVRAARSALRVQLSERRPELRGIAPDRFAETASSLRLPHLPHPSHRVPRERFSTATTACSARAAMGDGAANSTANPRADLSARGVGQVPVREAPAPGDLVEGGTGDGLQRAHELGIEESRGRTTSTRRACGANASSTRAVARGRPRGLKVPTRRRRIRRARAAHAVVIARVDRRESATAWIKVLVGSVSGIRIPTVARGAQVQRGAPGGRESARRLAVSTRLLVLVLGVPRRSGRVRQVRHRGRWPCGCNAAAARAAARAAGARCRAHPTTPRRRNRLGSQKPHGALGCPDSLGLSGTLSPPLTAPCRVRALRASSLGARGLGVPLPRRARGPCVARTADARSSLNGALDSSGFVASSREQMKQVRVVCLVTLWSLACEVYKFEDGFENEDASTTNANTVLLSTRKRENVTKRNLFL